MTIPGWYRANLVTGVTFVFGKLRLRLFTTWEKYEGIGDVIGEPKVWAMRLSSRPGEYNGLLFLEGSKLPVYRQDMPSERVRRVVCLAV